MFLKVVLYITSSPQMVLFLEHMIVYYSVSMVIAYKVLTMKHRQILPLGQDLNGEHATIHYGGTAEFFYSKTSNLLAKMRISSRQSKVIFSNK